MAACLAPGKGRYSLLGQVGLHLQGKTDQQIESVYFIQGRFILGKLAKGEVQPDNWPTPPNNCVPIALLSPFQVETGSLKPFCQIQSATQEYGFCRL